MLRWFLLTSTIAVGAFALLFVSPRPRPPAQPIRFSHKVHLDYFRDGRHRDSMVDMHEKTLTEDYRQDGRHGRSMVSMHEKILSEEYVFGDRHRQQMLQMHHDVVQQKADDRMLAEQLIEFVGQWQCIQCHGGFARGTKQLVKLNRCAQCHRDLIDMEEASKEEILGGILEKVEHGRCSLCHGSDLDMGTENLAKLDTCAACHGVFVVEGKTNHTEAVDSMMQTIDQGRCTACHGDFDRGTENLVRLGNCAECHRSIHAADFVGREKQRPCLACHQGLFDLSQTVLPSDGMCAACHLPALGDSREEAKLVEYLEQERPIPWTPVYDYLPGDVVFTHERHVIWGRVHCSQCHGPVALAEQPLALEVKLSMEDCMSCHEATGADNDCLACHR